MGHRIRHPFSAVAVLGTLAHHSFELGNGVGLVWQPELGLPGSAVLWTSVLSGWSLTALRGGGPRSDAFRSMAAGTALAGSLVHYWLWPWRRGPLGLPVLVEAEGLPPARLPAYNAILWVWGAGALLALFTETPRRARPWAAVGFASMPLLVRSARHHFIWVKEQAAERPAWWNRGVRPA